MNGTFKFKLNKVDILPVRRGAYFVFYRGPDPNLYILFQNSLIIELKLNI